MKLLRAFVAGLIFPAAVLPIAYSLLYLANTGQIRIMPLQFFPLYIPIVFGLWNAMDFLIGDRCPVKDNNTRLWVTGISLGVLASIVGVFFLALPQLLFGFTGLMVYVPLIAVPIFYGLIWRYIIKFFNQLLGL